MRGCLTCIQATKVINALAELISQSSTAEINIQFSTRFYGKFDPVYMDTLTEEYSIIESQQSQLVVLRGRTLSSWIYFLQRSL